MLTSFSTLFFTTALTVSIILMLTILEGVQDGGIVKSRSQFIFLLAGIFVILLGVGVCLKWQGA